mgnify:FL=1
MKTKRDIEQEVTDKIIAQLENGTAPWRKSWASIDGGVALRENSVPYRGFNQFLLSISGYSNPYWVTFNKAAELSGLKKDAKGKWIREEGKGVLSGQEGTHVFFFKKLKIKDKATGEDKMIPLMKWYSVFNADQCGNLPARYTPTKVERTELERDALSEAFIAGAGADIRYGGGRAYYSPSTDFIQLPEVDDFDNYVSYAGTAIHELAHWTGHESRLDRDLKNTNGTRDRAREELVAETSACLIAAHLGLEVEPREDHAAYLASWLEVLKNDKTALRKAFSKAQDVVDYLYEIQPAVLEEAA